MYRFRRIGASVLAVLTAILLLLTSLGWWADRYLLNSERFTASANKILDQETVQTALAVAITDQISAAAGTDLRIVQPFISSIVTGIVQSDQFQSVFDAAVLRAHKATVGGGARDAVLNLSEVVDRVRSAIEPIAPNIAEKIPSGRKLQLRLLDETQVNSFYGTLDFVKKLFVVLTVLTVLCFAGALALSPRRWRTLALTGWVVFGLFVARLVAQRVGRGLVGGLSDTSEYNAAARSSYQVILHGLAVQTVVILVIALLVALFAGWTERHGGWAGVTAAVRRATTWVKAQVPKRAPAAAPALATAGAAVGAGAAEAGATAEAEPETTARAIVEGALAPRLPEPKSAARATHWWRAAGLLVLGLFAVFSPGSLTTVVVVLLGVAALYLAVTEAVAAWGTPATPATPDAATPEEPTTE
jgi:hypothetical protein